MKSYGQKYERRLQLITNLCHIDHFESAASFLCVWRDLGWC